MSSETAGSKYGTLREMGLARNWSFHFAHSPKHAGLYQRLGCWLRFLTVRTKLCGLADAGLDLTSEIQSVKDQNMGETLLLWGGDSLDVFAVCHCGKGTEAGHNTCYVKFGAVAPGPKAESGFDHLLDASGALAAAHNLKRVESGMNLNRSQAYRQMRRRGFRTDIQGVAMHKPDSPAYNRPDAYGVDDWR
jgi:hypothetical protein